MHQLLTMPKACNPNYRYAGHKFERINYKILQQIILRPLDA